VTTRVVVDASALAALAFGEPAGDDVARQLEGATVSAPTLLKFELASVARKKMRRHPEVAQQVLAALADTLGAGGINWRDVDVADAVLIAHTTGLSAYDASYIWLAGSLGADLVTLDTRLAKAAAGMADQT
jgi:predicted nucleic acid-binding protein